MRSLPDNKVEFFAVVARRIVPETADLDDAETAEFFAIIDSALMDRPENVRRQFAVFLAALRLAPALRWAQPFERLEGNRQDATLRWFEDCPIGLLRKGFWGLKALVFMGYYGRKAAWQDVGYDPRFNGRERLHD